MMDEISSPNLSSNSTHEMDTNDSATKVVVRVEDNDKKMLDELFNLASNSHLKSKPMKDRNLPQSFFNTQNNSSKQLCRQLLSNNPNQSPFGFDQFPQPNTVTTPFPGASQAPLNPNLFKSRNYPHSNHTRSRSSPATCYGQNTLKPPVNAEFGIQDFHTQQQQQHQQQQQQQHQQQQPTQQQPFPQENWMEHLDDRRTHQPGYPFCGNEPHSSVSTQANMEFPSISHPNSRLMQHPTTTGYPIRHSRAHSQVDHLTLTLPKGWERGVTPEGDVFYIDHNARTTSWTHPSLPQHGSGFFPQGMGSPQHRPSWFQPGELTTIREIAQQQHLFSRLNINDDSNYSHSHQGSQDSGIGITGAEQTIDSIQPMENFLLSKLDNSSSITPQLLPQEPMQFPGSNVTLTDDTYIGNPSEVSEFTLNFESGSPTHYDVSNLHASISTEMLLEAVTNETNISQS